MESEVSDPARLRKWLCFHTAAVAFACAFGAAVAFGGEPSGAAMVAMALLSLIPVRGSPALLVVRGQEPATVARPVAVPREARAGTRGAAAVAASASSGAQ